MRAGEEQDRQTAEIEDMAAFKSKQTQDSQSDNAMAGRPSPGRTGLSH